MPDPIRIAFPLGPGASLELLVPENYAAEEGWHTLLTATEVLAGALATMKAKDRLYGGAWREQGWMGNLARVMSKAARLRKMLWRDCPLEDANEPIQDTIQDMINLLVFLTLNRQGGNRWGRGLDA